MVEERNRLQSDLDNMVEERNLLQSALDNMVEERNHLQRALDYNVEKRNLLQSALDKMVEERNRLQSNLDNMVEERNRLQTAFNTSLKQQDALLKTLNVFMFWFFVAGNLCMCWQNNICSCYYKSHSKKNWQESRNDCRERGSDLIVVNSKEEQDFVPEGFWLGLTDAEVEGTWKWVDGTPLTTAYWGHPQPDNNGRDPNKEEDCVERYGTGEWNDISCLNNLYWICEKNLDVSALSTCLIHINCKVFLCRPNYMFNVKAHTGPHAGTFAYCPLKEFSLSFSSLKWTAPSHLVCSNRPKSYAVVRGVPSTHFQVPSFSASVKPSQKPKGTISWNSNERDMNTHNICQEITAMETMILGTWQETGDSWSEREERVVDIYDSIDAHVTGPTAQHHEPTRRNLCTCWQNSSCSCYYKSHSMKNWNDSRKDCRERGSDLIVINSKEEQDFVPLDFWLGLTDAEVEGTWKWVDGTPLTTA
ncbi:unnamed protein product [Lota lota]